MENVDDIAVYRNRRPFRRRRKRNNGKKTRLVDLTNEQLKHHTRFSKMSIKQMANTFREELTQDSRGRPLSVEIYHLHCPYQVGDWIS